MRAAHEGALDVGRAARPGDEIDVARRGRVAFGIGVILEMAEDARALDDADMVQRQERQKRRRLRP